MDTQSQFNLTMAVERWLNQFRQLDQLTEDELLELQSHLQDSIETLYAKGLSQQEAFQIASQRLGSVNLLAEEFGKLAQRLPEQRESVLLLLGVICFIVSKHAFETITAFSAVCFASIWGDSLTTSWLDASAGLIALAGLQIVGMRLFSQTNQLRYLLLRQIKRNPVGLTLILGGLVGATALSAYAAQHGFDDLLMSISQQSWVHQSFHSVHYILWLGFYLVWLILLLQVVLPYAVHMQLLSWLKQAPVAWLIVAGICAFTCCLGLSVIGVRIVPPANDVARFYVCAGVSSLLSSAVLASSPRYSPRQIILIALAPLLIWYGIALGNAILWQEKSTYLVLDWFPTKFLASAYIGALAGLWLGTVKNRATTIS